MTTNQRLVLFFSILAAGTIAVALPRTTGAINLDPLPVPIKVDPISTKPECIITGCSSELCVDKSKGPHESLCVYKEEYACLRYSKCEVQSNGQCGWTQTDEYKFCLGGGTKPEPTKQIPPPIVVTPIPYQCNGICEADDTCPKDQVCVSQGKCPSDCPNGYPPPDTQPVCGNNICEAGEADSSWCPSCQDPPRCPLISCFAKPGTCPSDCSEPGTPPKITPQPRPSCTPRPTCLDSNPPCDVYIPPEGFNWCPPSLPIPTGFTCDIACPDGSVLVPPCSCANPQLTPIPPRCTMECLEGFTQNWDCTCSPSYPGNSGNNPNQSPSQHRLFIPRIKQLLSSGYAIPQVEAIQVPPRLSAWQEMVETLKFNLRFHPIFGAFFQDN